MTATTYPLSLSPVTRAYLSSGLDLAKTNNVSLILSNAYPLRIVSTLSYLLCYSAYFIVLAQSHTAVLHLTQTTPPIILMN